MGTHTAACLCNGSAHAGKLFPRNTESEKSANDYLTQTIPFYQLKLSPIYGTI